MRRHLQDFRQREKLHVAYEPRAPLDLVHLDPPDLVPTTAHMIGNFRLENAKLLAQLSDPFADSILFFRFNGFNDLFQSGSFRSFVPNTPCSRPIARQVKRAQANRVSTVRYQRSFLRGPLPWLRGGRHAVL